jgi:hypothetical protein
MATVNPVSLQPQPRPEYLTTEEVAQLCRVTRVGGRRVLYRAAEVRQWIEEQFEEQDVPA